MASRRLRAPHQEHRRRRGREQRRHDPLHCLGSSGASRRRRDQSLERYQPRRRSAERSNLEGRAEDGRRCRHDRETRGEPHRSEMSSERGSAHRHGARSDSVIDGDGGNGPEISSEGSRRSNDSRRDRSQSRPRGRGRGGRGNNARRPKLSVPDNWADVPKIGSKIASSRFVAMRVPLDDKFTRMIRSPDEVWTPEIFLQSQASDGHNVRLLIDLTNTSKYYDGELEFRGSNVKYVKLCIEGFKAPPRESEVEAFTRIVDEFIVMEPEGNIAVHCTHGLNRTGYLVVSYLVRRTGLSVQEALKAFSDARPPGLIKHMYVEELFRQFAPEAGVELPELPAWATAKYAARRRQ